MYASDWIFTLFTNIIPVSQIHHFFDGFFESGWLFFYKFTLTFLKCLENKILEQDDISGILTLIKLKGVKNENLLATTETITDEQAENLESPTSNKSNSN